MLAFGIRYLNGFAAGTAPDSHERPEWPPHPARVFMALVAAHFETGADPSERSALQWLETLGPPHIHAPNASPRASVTHYVPVNDKAGDKTDPPTAPIASAPSLTRDRQPRTFARVWLEHDTVYIFWPEANPDDAHRTALQNLCAKVTRIGHSTSLVHMWLACLEEVPPPTHIPDHDRATVFLRITGAGTLQYLEQIYNRTTIDEWAKLKVMSDNPSNRKSQQSAKRQRKENDPDSLPQRRRPEIRIFHGYAHPSTTDTHDTIQGSVFHPHFIVCTFEPESGPYLHLDLLCTLPLVQHWREAILAHSNNLPNSTRRILSGHDDQGNPLQEPHLAFLPLAFIGHPHADGHLLGMGLVLPNELPPSDRRHALQAIARVERLTLGRLGTWRIDSSSALGPLHNLRTEVWTAHPHGATHWSTVTPIAFDRHPHHSIQEIAQMIAQAATRIGLPEPREVIVTHVSAHLGVPPAYAFPRLPRKDGSQRRHTHAIIVFPTPVRGPVILGAGRFRGYGVCRPLSEGDLE